MTLETSEGIGMVRSRILRDLDRDLCHLEGKAHIADIMMKASKDAADVSKAPAPPTKATEADTAQEWIVREQAKNNPGENLNPFGRPEKV